MRTGHSSRVRYKSLQNAKHNARNLNNEFDLDESELDITRELRPRAEFEIDENAVVLVQISINQLLMLCVQLVVKKV